MLLAARQGRGTLRGQISQPDPIQCGHGALLFLTIEETQAATPARHTAQATDQDVVHHAETIDQIELLKDVADVGAQASHLAIETPGRLNLTTQHLNLTAIAAITARQTRKVT